MKHEAIKDAWTVRNKLRAASSKRYGDGYTHIYNSESLHDESAKLYDEGNKLLAAGHKLLADGDRLRIEGKKLYTDAVAAKYGDKAIFDMKTGEITTH